jgi:hypothetical protein
MHLRLLWVSAICLSSSSFIAQKSEVDFDRLIETIDYTMVTQGIPTQVDVADAGVADYIHLMDSLDAKSLKPSGYRIQVFSASGPNAKNIAFEKQAELLELFSNTGSYTIWNYPNWVIRIGNFRTRLEALQFHEQVKAKYPASFIIKDEIEIKYE